MRRITQLIAVSVVLVGFAIMAIGGVTMMKASSGIESLNAVYEAQGLELAYNEDGQLVDRGTTEGADAIMTLLVDDWKFPVDDKAFDPADPLVNTPTELMYQFATISYHTLHSTVNVTLDEAVEYEGETFAAGTYEFDIDGRYWNDFDRLHPIEGPARAMAWSPTAHGLLAELSAGTAADMLAGFSHFTGWKTILIGFAFALGGAGLFTSTLIKKEEEERLVSRSKEYETVV